MVEIDVPSSCVRLGVVRGALVPPTLLLARLAEDAGAAVRVPRVGRVEVELGDGTAVSIRVTLVNPYDRAAATYRRLGKPIPQWVLDGSKAWRQEHGM